MRAYVVNATRMRVSDLMRELIKAPQTRESLIELCGMDDTAVRMWLKALVAAGVVWRSGSGHRYSPYVYHLCRVPFEAPPSALEGQACV